MMQQWFRDAKFGISLHWGIYAVNGTVESWAFFSGDIPYDVYMSQLEGFTARHYDPAAWAQLFKKVGAKYAVLTSKHHDGVALWDTDAGDLSVVKQTPAGRDLVGPFCHAVRDAGLKVGLYFSHLDWSHPDYRAVYPDPAIKTREEYQRFLAQKGEGLEVSAAPRAAFNPHNTPADGLADPEAWERFLTFHRAQLTELMTRYGTIDQFVFDGHWERTAEQWRMAELRETLHAMNPNVVLNSRMCGYGDYDTPEQGMPLQPCPREWEFWFTVNDNWGYRPSDRNYKSTRQLIRMFADCIGMGGNVLLNVAPMEDGTIDPEQEQRLLEFGDWLVPNGEAVYETVAGLPPGHFNGASTLSKDKSVLYLFYYDRPLEALAVKGVFNAIRKVTVLKTGKELAFKAMGGMPPWNIPAILWIDLPDEDVDDRATVLKVELEGALRLYTGDGTNSPG